MAKHRTCPTLYDEVKTVSITFLKSHKYLEPEGYKGGSIIWSRNGVETGNINICVSTYSESLYLELDYKCNQIPINYRVQLVSIPSNLGKGVIWFFVCPHTGKRCRKLYLGSSYFYHRSAFNGCMYEKQTQSKKSRELDKTFGAYYYANDKIFEQLYQKHFKKYYAGKPTKRYLRITKLLSRAESIPYDNILRLLKH